MRRIELRLFNNSLIISRSISLTILLAAFFINDLSAGDLDTSTSYLNQIGIRVNSIRLSSANDQYIEEKTDKKIRSLNYSGGISYLHFKKNGNFYRFRVNYFSNMYENMSCDTSLITSQYTCTDITSKSSNIRFAIGIGKQVNFKRFFFLIGVESTYNRTLVYQRTVIREEYIASSLVSGGRTVDKPAKRSGLGLNTFQTLGYKISSRFVVQLEVYSGIYYARIKGKSSSTWEKYDSTGITDSYEYETELNNYSLVTTFMNPSVSFNYSF
ncbi:MAG: hypothetical protein IH948_00845 [Bacteroidetes bacterium]|nr:hypothetical protein [Bacteroidota bacterium]